MFRRIIVVAFLLLSFMCLSVNGQTAIVYSYDSAGNRTSRTTVEATDVASVSSVMPIDAYGRLNSSPAVSNILCNIASLASGEVEEKAENSSLMWRFDFLENKRPMNEYAHNIGKYGWMSLSWIDFYKRDWIGNEALL